MPNRGNPTPSKGNCNPSSSSNHNNNNYTRPISYKDAVNNNYPNKKRPSPVETKKNIKEVVSSSSSEEDGDSTTPLMVLIGPDKYTKGVITIMKSVLKDNNSGLRRTLKFKGSRLPEDDEEDCNELLMKIVKNKKVKSVLYIVDSQDPYALERVGVSLSNITSGTAISIDCVDFIFAKDDASSSMVSISPRSLHEFVQKWGRPMITIVFSPGWENDPELRSSLDQMFLKNPLPPSTSTLTTPPTEDASTTRTGE